MAKEALKEVVHISMVSPYEFYATFDALIESPYMSLVIVNREGYITLMNQTFLDSLELTKADVIGKHVLEILPHSQLPEVLETGRVDKADIWPIKDQDTIVTRVPIIKDGKIIGAIGQSLSTDMSGAKIFMKRLQEREKEFTALFEALVESPYMLYVAVDTNGYITAMNQTYLDILKVKKEDVIGKYVLDITPNSGLIEVLKTGRIDNADIWAIKGQQMIVTRLPVIKNGQIVGALAKSLFLDMSGAKILMQKLQETEKDFATILEGLIESPYMVYVIVDKEGYITAMNQTYLDILEMKKEDVVGKYILDITPTSELPDILKTGRIDKADIWPIKGRDTIVTRLPIIKDSEIVGAIGKSLFLDMSGAKILMKKMQETEKEFASILEGLIESPYMVFVIVDKEGYITTMNQTYLDILEMKKEDVLGKYILDITPTSELPQVLKTGRIDKADIYFIKGRETIVTRLPIVKDGEVVGAIGKSLFLDMSGAKILVKKLQDTEKELNIYKEEVRKFYKAKWQFPDLVGQSPAFLAIKTMAEHVSHTTSTLLITGESGTGKELFAQAIHNASQRKSGPFIRINCAALPDTLLESELFGYEEGAFTGARKGGKQGKFELARGGTIFLDEIGDMPLAMQTKMLTVLQERTVERIGGTMPIPVNVRVIAATNRNLEDMVSKQEFRQDLYYRLNVVRLSIPPLRKRQVDVLLIGEDLIDRINHNLKTAIIGISDQARELLQDYSWPGNVRELENLLERAVNLADMNHENYLTAKHFPSLIEETFSVGLPEEENINLTEAVENLEKQIITQALVKTSGNRVHTAKILGIHSSALYRKISKYGLD
ncbi:MAG: sigma 54-interacting transcriptional regulator [Syntrophomonas sp.]|nr:sigma 54-interacting transcriptional regulator [Syntrophomonas sp.]